MKTYNDIYLSARRRLKAAGIEAFDVEARLFAVAVSGKTREQFVRDKGLIATDDFEKKVDGLIARRKSGEPVAYILGEWEFYGMPITVNRHVLIPRADTEVLAEAVIKVFEKNLDGTRVLDLCTGSGCVGLAIAAHVPFCRAVLADKSAEALRVCRINIIKNNLTRSTTTLELNALEAPPMLLGEFDVIVCNPPYIPAADIAQLDTSVKDFEPLTALDGGKDGLIFYKNIAAKWKTVLKSGGLLAFECGIGQAVQVAGILKQNGFEHIQIIRDTRGIERVVLATRQK
ncbi:peptide chain release factor N(5)-glutamine methyltransferase [Oscillospiraceae bacterium CM]|nr:peptide chain release factor N(5)-glutamine methyltransferase [Oscillospiraceae bacterium CM]